MKLHKILVPIDYSESSRQALRWAASLAQQYEAQLLLLHVIPKALEEATKQVHTSEWVPYRGYAAMSPEADPFCTERVIIDLLEDARTQLYDLVVKEVEGTLSADVQVAVGKPAAEILRVAHEEAVDLIVMGTHGRSGLAKLFLGSVAGRVVAAATCPVLTVRGRGRK